MEVVLLLKKISEFLTHSGLNRKNLPSVNLNILKLIFKKSSLILMRILITKGLINTNFLNMLITNTIVSMMKTLRIKVKVILMNTIFGIILKLMRWELILKILRFLFNFANFSTFALLYINLKEFKRTIFSMKFKSFPICAKNKRICLNKMLLLISLKENITSLFKKMQNKFL